MNIAKRETRYCSIYGCNSRSTEEKDIRFFRFPKKGTIEYKIWMPICKESCGRIESLKKPFVCSLHFLPEDIGKKRLLQKAVPCLNLSKPIEYVDQKQLNSKIVFMEKVMREWIFRSRCYQNISPKTLSNVSRDVRKLLGISRNIPNPIWMREFKYLPILPDRDGMIFVSRPYCRSHIVEVIRDLRNTDRQEPDEKQQQSFQVLPIKSEAKLNDDVEYQVPRSESTFVDGDRETKIQITEDTKDGVLNSYDQPESDVKNKTIDSYEDALEYLKPLQYFVKEKNEYFAAIRLLAQLQAIFKDRTKGEGDSRLFKRTMY